MPTIACGEDDPLPISQGAVPPNSSSTTTTTITQNNKPLERPRSGRGVNNSNNNFENQYKALSQRLGGTQTHQDSSTDSSSNNTSLPSALEILKGGTCSLSQLFLANAKSSSSMSEQSTNNNNEQIVPLSELASEFAQEFKEIEKYHYSLEKERELKEREDELHQKKKLREEAKRQKMLRREEKKLNELEHGGIDEGEQQQQQLALEDDERATNDESRNVGGDDGRQTVYSSVAASMFRNGNNQQRSTSRPTALTNRDDLYEVPLSVASAGGPMKRRMDGAVKATTGYRKMFSNNNSNSTTNLQHPSSAGGSRTRSGYQNGVAPLLEKIASNSNNNHNSNNPRSVSRSARTPSSEVGGRGACDDAQTTNGADENKMSTANNNNNSMMVRSSSSQKQQQQHFHRFATDNASVTSDAFSITAGKRKTRNIVPIHNKIAVIAVQQQNQSQRRSNNNNNNNDENQTGKLQNSNGDDENSNNDDDDDEGEFLVEDEGAIKFCCFRICSRNRKTGAFECGVCQKSFSQEDETEDEQQQQQQHSGGSNKQNHSIEIQAGETAGNDAQLHRETTSSKQIVVARREKIVTEDDETGEAEQQRLFQLAVMQWRKNAGNSNLGEQSDENDQERRNDDDASDYEELFIQQRKRCPDVNEFVYFSKLWECLLNLDDE